MIYTLWQFFSFSFSSFNFFFAHERIVVGKQRPYNTRCVSVDVSSPVILLCVTHIPSVCVCTGSPFAFEFRSRKSGGACPISWRCRAGGNHASTVGCQTSKYHLSMWWYSAYKCITVIHGVCIGSIAQCSHSYLQCRPTSSNGGRQFRYDSTSLLLFLSWQHQGDSLSSHKDTRQSNL